MSERTLATNSEEVKEITPDETQEVDAISSETVTEDDESKKHKRNKRNIIITPQTGEEGDGMNYRFDANGESRLVID